MIKQIYNIFKICWHSSKRLFTLNISLYFLSSLLIPSSIYLIQKVINSIESYMYDGLGIINVIENTFLLIFILLNISVFQFFKKILNIKIGIALNEYLTPIILLKFKKIEYCYYEEDEFYDTLDRMSRNPHGKILEFFVNSLNIISAFFTIMSTVLIFIQVSIWFGLSLLFIILPMLWLDFKSMNNMNTMFNNQSLEERKQNYLNNLLNDKYALHELKIFKSDVYILKKIKKSIKKILSERLEITIQSQRYYFISTLLIIVWTIYILYNLLFSYVKGSITVGIFVALIGSIGTVLYLSEDLSFTFSKIAQRYLELFQLEKFLSLSEIRDNNNNNYYIQNPHIIFDNVSFKYPNSDVEILKDISFEIKPNEHVALVGINGAGKSTIIKLLCKLYKPSSGKILINQIDINELSNEQISKIFSAVFQDFVKYSLTLRENIMIGNIELYNDYKNSENFFNCQFLDFLSLYKMNLDVNLGNLEDDGINLSGGQWQKVAIARAYMSHAPFLILDEPTASLDPEAEYKIYNLFLELSKSRGCIIVSHRLASARFSDKIIVLNNGYIEDIGTHSCLMAKEGLYKEMFINQSSWYKEEELKEY